MATVSSLGAEPLAGETSIQSRSSTAVKPSVPPPVLDTATVCSVGPAVPATPVKLSALFETASCGEACAAETTCAETGPSLQSPSDAHVAGSAESERPALVFSGPPA